MSILIAYNLKKYRESKNLSQRKLSTEIGSVSKSSIALYEKNERTPSIEIQEKICKVLDITLEMLNGQEQKDYFTNKLKKFLSDDKITANEYQYIYNYFIHFFDNDQHFSLKNIDFSRYEKNAKSYIKNILLGIDNYMENKNIKEERKKAIRENIILFLNNFVTFTITINDKNDIYITVDLKKSLVQEYMKLDINFLKTFVELKPVYIEILNKLNNMYSSKDTSIEVYFKKTTDIIDYISITTNLVHNNFVIHAVKIEDNFMFPRFGKNDIVILQEHEKYEDGQFIAIVDEKHNILVGKLKYEKDFIILQPINLNYTPIIITNNKFKFLGEVIETRYNNNNNK